MCRLHGQFGRRFYQCSLTRVASLHGRSGRCLWSAGPPRECRPQDAYPISTRYRWRSECVPCRHPAGWDSAFRPPARWAAPRSVTIGRHRKIRDHIGEGVGLQVGIQTVSRTARLGRFSSEREASQQGDDYKSKAPTTMIHAISSLTGSCPRPLPFRSYHRCRRNPSSGNLRWTSQLEKSSVLRESTPRGPSS